MWSRYAGCGGNPKKPCNMHSICTNYVKNVCFFAKMQRMQKKICTPHISPCWSSLEILLALSNVDKDRSSLRSNRQPSSGSVGHSVFQWKKKLRPPGLGTRMGRCTGTPTAAAAVVSRPIPPLSSALSPCPIPTSEMGQIARCFSPWRSPACRLSLSFP